jgi:hypothetical protein
MGNQVCETTFQEKEKPEKYNTLTIFSASLAIIVAFEIGSGAYVGAACKKDYQV